MEPVPGEEVPLSALCMAVDAQGVLWVGTWGDGVAEYDGETWQYFTTADGLGGNHILCLAAGPESAVWVGTDGGGVSRRMDKTWRTYRKEDGLGGSRVQMLAADAGGGVWALVYDNRSNRNGLAYLDGTQWLFTEPERGISALIAGRGRGIWLIAEESVVHVLP